MGQLKLTLSDPDVEAIRAQATAQGLGVSAYVRAVVLGSQPSADVLDQLQSQLASLTRRLSEIEARSPWDEIADHERRLSQIEALAERGY